MDYSLKKALLLLFFSLSVVISNGQSRIDWVSVNKGLEGDRIDLIWQSPSGIFFAGGMGGLFSSPNLFDSWKPTPLRGTSVSSISSDSSGQILVGTNKGLFLSSDEGQSWQHSGFQTPILDFAINSEGIIALATTEGVYLQQENAGDWILIGQWSSEVSNQTAETKPVYSVAFLNSGAILATLDDCVYRMSDDQEWTCVISPLSDEIRKLYKSNAPNGPDVFAASFQGVYEYYDETQSDSIIASIGTVYDLDQTKKSLFAIALATASSSGPLPGGVYQYNLENKSWSLIGLSGEGIYDIEVDQQEAWICLGILSGVICSLDGGDSWKPWNDGLNNYTIRAISATESGSIFAGTANGAFVLRPGSDMWEPLNIEEKSSSINDISGFALGSETTMFAYGRSGIFLSEDDGYTWNKASGGWRPNADKLEYQNERNRAILDNTISISNSLGFHNYIGTDCKTTSTNPSFVMSNGSLYKGRWPDVLWSDDGWETVKELANVDIYGDAIFEALTFAVDGTLLISARETEQDGPVTRTTKKGVILRTKNNGDSWLRTILGQGILIQDMAVHPEGPIIAATNQGLYRSLDDGETWQETLHLEEELCVVKVSDQGIIVAGDSYFSTDQGATWNIFDTQLPTNEIRSLTFAEDGTLYVGTFGRGVFKSHSPIRVDSELNRSTGSLEVKLYPNPVVTKVNLIIDLPQESNITIELYDALGRFLMTTRNNFLQKGENHIVLNSFNFPNGFYTLRISANGQESHLPFFYIR